jgi:DNA-binding SARP family transcriptional activator
VIESPGGIIGPAAEIVFGTTLYLAAQPGVSVLRGDLRELLWPDADRREGGQRLRQTLYQMKRRGIPVEHDETAVRLARSAVRADYDELTGARAVDLAAALRLTSPRVLPDYTPDFSRHFTTWVEERRAHLHVQLRSACIAAMPALRAAARHDDMVVVCRACLDLDPANGECLQALAEALALAGRPREAVALLDAGLDASDAGREPRGRQARALRRRIVGALADAGKPPDTPFVGRREELARLVGLIGDAKRGERRGCLMWGEAGIGKSRLAGELCRIAEVSGLQVERVKCQPIDEGRPLSAFIDLVPRLRALPGAAGCDPDSLHVLRRLSELADGDAPSAPAGDASSIAASIRRAIRDLVDAVSAERTLMLYVDDAQWLDAASWRLLGELLRLGEGTGVVVCCASRRGPRAQPCADATRTCAALEHVRIQSLALGDASTLVDSLASAHRDAAELDDERRAWCLALGNGNPLYLRELVAHCAAGSRMSISPSLRRLLAGRIDALEPTTRRVLQAVAVLGTLSSLGRLGPMLEVGAIEIAAAFDELDAGDFVRVREGAVTCSHDLLADAALASLSASTAVLLHRQAALVLERELEREPTSAVLWACAEHWRLAGNAEQGVILARRRGAHLVRLGLGADAATIFEATLPHCATRSDRLDIMRRWRDAEMHARHWDRAIEVAQARRALVLREADADVHRWDDEVAILDAQMARDGPCAEFGPGLRACLWADAAPLALRIQAASLLVQVAVGSGDPSITAGMGAMLRALEPADRSMRLSWLTALVTFETIFGDLDYAATLADTLLALARIDESDVDLPRTLRRCADARLRIGDDAAYESLMTESIERATQARVWSAVIAGHTGLMGYALLRGDLDVVRKRLRAFELALRGFDNDVQRFDVDVATMHLALAEGNALEARRLYAELEPRIRKHPRSRLVALRIDVEVRRQLGELTADDPRLSEMEALCERCAVGAPIDVAMSTLARALIETGQVARARRIWTAYTTEWRRDRFPLGRDAAAVDAILAPIPMTDPPAGLSPV